MSANDPSLIAHITLPNGTTIDQDIEGDTYDPHELAILICEQHQLDHSDKGDFIENAINKAVIKKLFQQKKDLIADVLANQQEHSNQEKTFKKRMLEAKKMIESYNKRLSKASAHEREMQKNVDEMLNDRERQGRVAVHHVLHRAWKRFLTGALIAWKAHTDEIYRHSLILAKTARILQRRKIYSAFRGWSHSVRVAIHTRQRLTRVIHRMKHRDLAVSYQQWYESISSRIQARSVVRTLLNRYSMWKKQNMRKCYHTWERHAAKLKHIETTTQHVLEEIIAIIATRTETTEHHVVVHKAEMVVLAQQHEKVLEQHIITEDELKNLEEIKLKVDKKEEQIQEMLTERQFQGAHAIFTVMFCVWKRLTTNTCKVWKQHTDGIYRHQQIVAKTARILVRRKIYSAFRGWSHSVRVAIHTRQRLTRIIQRMRHHDMAVSYRQWYESISLQIYARSVVRTLLNRYSMWKKQNMYECFVKWHRKAVAATNLLNIETKEQEIEAMCQQRQIQGAHAIHSALSRVWKRLTTNACTTWKQHTDEIYRHSLIVAKTARILHRRKMYTAFRGWRQGILSAIDRRQRLTRVIQRMRNQDMAMCYGQWYEFISLRTRARSVIRTLVNRHSMWKKQKVHRYFIHWEKLTNTARLADSLTEIVTMQTELQDMESKLEAEEIDLMIARRTTQRAMQLIDMTKIIASKESIDDLFCSVISQAQLLLNADRSTLWLVDNKTQELWSKIATRSKPIRIPINTGCVGQCVTTNQSLRIDDAYDCEFFNQDVDKRSGYKTTSVLVVPVISDNGNILGALQVINKLSKATPESTMPESTMPESTMPAVFNEEDEHLLGTFCAHLAVAIVQCENNDTNTREMNQGVSRLQALEQQLLLAEQREHETTIEKGRAMFMMELSTSLAGDLEIGSIIQNVCTQTKKLLECDRCTLFVVSQEGRQLYTRFAEGADTITVPIDEGIVGETVEKNATLNIPDAYKDNRFNRVVDQRTGYRTKAILSVPISNRSGEIVGVLQSINKLNDACFSQADVNIAQQFAKQIGISISKSLAHGQTEEEMAMSLKNLKQLEAELEHVKLLTADDISIAKKRQLRTEKLMELTQSLLSQQELSSVFENVMISCRELLECDRATLFCLDTEKKEMFSQVAHDTTENIRFVMSKGLAGQAAVTKSTVNVADCYLLESFNREFDLKTGYRTKSVLCVAIFGKEGEVVGVVQAINKLQRQDRSICSFDEDDEILLSKFAKQIAVAINNCEERKRLNLKEEQSTKSILEKYEQLQQKIKETVLHHEMEKRELQQTIMGMERERSRRARLNSVDKTMEDGIAETLRLISIENERKSDIERLVNEAETKLRQKYETEMNQNTVTVQHYRQQIMHNVIGRMSARILAKALMKWWIETRKAKRLRQYIYRWEKINVGKCYRKWNVELHNRKRVQGFLYRWKFKHLGKSLNKWIAEIRKRKRVRIFLRRWRHVQLRKSFLKWFCEVQQNKRVSTRMRRYTQRWLHKTMSRAFRKWFYEIRQNKKIRRFLQRMLHRNTCKAFEGWISYVHLEQQLKTKQHEYQAEIMKLQQTIDMTSKNATLTTKKMRTMLKQTKEITMKQHEEHQEEIMQLRAHISTVTARHQAEMQRLQTTLEFNSNGSLLQTEMEYQRKKSKMERLHRLEVNKLREAAMVESAAREVETSVREEVWRERERSNIKHVAAIKKERERTLQATTAMIETEQELQHVRQRMKEDDRKREELKHSVAMYQLELKHTSIASLANIEDLKKNMLKMLEDERNKHATDMIVLEEEAREETAIRDRITQTNVQKQNELQRLQMQHQNEIEHLTNEYNVHEKEKSDKVSAAAIEVEETADSIINWGGMAEQKPNGYSIANYVFDLARK